ncbi:oligosaccharide flippase family protein [Cetobacterium sp. 8H]|uniref:oligosaccharide flippase family protein n=1 Tax=Cetobacterium sp. 8H TaxID=2759681 RepID=UPI00163BB311|nr:oligosaccharide flippase family protein [Cetobacterium sp. 8H]MBC2850933.1 oligosaccharide flippase family protein [Cetobacterium sp. 8H]
MSEKISKNLQINFIITLGTGILGFVINKYFADYMGIDILGLMKLFTQMVAYLSLVDLGISSASSYALYKPLADKDISKINLIVSTIDSFYKKIASIIFVLGLLLSFSLCYFIDLESYGNKIYLYWILYVVNTSIGYLFAKYSILFTANQEYGFVRKVQGLGKLLFQCIQIICLVKIQSFIIFITIMILENVYSYYFYRRHYQKNYNYIKKIKDRDKNIIKDIRSLFWHKIGGLIVHNTDYIILSKFVSLSIVGIYSSYLMIYQIIITIVNIITPVITPKIGLFVVKNAKNDIYIYWRKLQVVYIFISTVCIICTYKLILPFVLLWLGNSFILPKVTVVLILINLFINLSKLITDSFKFSCGFFDDTHAPIIESFLNLIISLVLVQKYGLNGVIIGTVVSNILIILLLKPILVFKRCFDKNWSIYIKDLSKLILLTVMTFIVVEYTLKILGLNFENILSWSTMVYKSFLLGIISLIIAFMIFSIDKFFRNFIIEILKSRDL